jgi:hypothetical protein
MCFTPHGEANCVEEQVEASATTVINDHLLAVHVHSLLSHLSTSVFRDRFSPFLLLLLLSLSSFLLVQMPFYTTSKNRP